MPNFLVDTADSVDLSMYFNSKEKEYPSRGLAFWRRKPPPKFYENPVEIKLPYSLGDNLGFAVRDKRDPQNWLFVTFHVDSISKTANL